MITNTFKKSTIALLVICLPVLLYGAETPIAAPASSANSMDINLVLLLVAILLLFPFYFTSKTFLMSVNDYVKKKTDLNKVNKTIVSSLFFIFLTNALLAQSSVDAPPYISQPKNLLTIMLSLVIAVEVISIIYFSWKTTQLINPEAVKIEGIEAAQVDQESAFEKFWNKINNFKPKGEEDTIDTGHNYDGIRELDNITPPWFTIGFMLSILFAIVYLYRYHIAESAPLQIEEYTNEMAAAEADKAKLNINQGPEITAANIVMLSAADIEKGKMYFSANCVTCHGANAASVPGGVGPNLTDQYWIHGGRIADVFNSISNGWTDKGMISWKSQLSSLQMAQIASYIESMKGKVSAGGKEPQGDLFFETIASDSTQKTTTDTLIVSK